MEIATPRRILAVSAPDCNILKFLKGKNNSHEMSVFVTNIAAHTTRPHRLRAYEIPRIQRRALAHMELEDKLL